MEQEYELNTRNVVEVIQEQLATPDFASQINYVPYKEFNGKGERVWSNLMSGHWAYMHAVCPFSKFFWFNPSLCFQDEISKDQHNHGAMFVPVVAGSDKTTVSVATGHQEYHPVYVSAGNLTNTARRAHGNAVLPVAFLPIPKSEHCVWCSVSWASHCD